MTYLIALIVVAAAGLAAAGGMVSQAQEKPPANRTLWAHPAITGTSIVVKDVDKVICWSFR